MLLHTTPVRAVGGVLTSGREIKRHLTGVVVTHYRCFIRIQERELS